MEPLPFRLLIIDDNLAIHSDFRKIFNPESHTTTALQEVEHALFGKTPGTRPLTRPRMTYEVDCADQGQKGLEMVTEALAAGKPYAVAFVDMRMPPGWDGLETIKEIWKVDSDIQVIVCTAYSDCSWEEMCHQLGMTDNLLILKKPFDISEVKQMAGAMARKWQLSRELHHEMEQLEQRVEERTRDLQLSRDQFSLTFHAAPMPQGLFRLRDCACLDVNAAFVRLTGRTPEQWKKNPLRHLGDTNLIAASDGPHPLNAREIDITTGRNGVRVAVYTQVVEFNEERCLLIMAVDISERNRLEEQLRQTQKMEAVGQLAAGIAHDFNNILTVIQGNLSLLSDRQDLSPADGEEMISQILGASKRAAALTRQLLTFSRRHLFQPVPLNVNDLIRDQASLLSRLLAENITIHTDLHEALPLAMGDALSIEQAVINLAINARDAMPNGGRLTLSTRAANVTAEDVLLIDGALPGSYVRISVTDSGHGMDGITQNRIFEPFFTTKGIGKGTGMGLAMVYATVRQHQGWITVESTLGKGSTFHVYLPITAEEAETAPADPDAAPESAAQDHLHVLLVEDDASVRQVLHQMLTKHGCKVTEGENADEGYRQWLAHSNDIDLVLTDIVMPGDQSGEDLGRRIQQADPTVSVIYSSGYSPSVYESTSGTVNPDNFLAKPYDARALGRRLTQISSLRRAQRCAPSTSDIEEPVLTAN